MAKHLDPTTRQNVIRLIREGLCTNEIRERTRVHTRTIANIAVKYNLLLVRGRNGPAALVVKKTLVPDPAREYRAKAAQLRWGTPWP